MTTDVPKPEWLITIEAQRECIRQLLSALERCKRLVGLISVRQVIENGGSAIDAAGLNPWCMNEGLATGAELISTWWLESAIAKAEELLK